MDCVGCTPRKEWKLPFLAQAEEVAALRRVLQLQLELWGLPELGEPAQLCVSELVANVIKHVGPGTPATLAACLSGNRLRLAVHDPDPRALPVLADASSDAESGRGMILVDAIADRWGVDLAAGRKATWCELRTGGVMAGGHPAGPRMTRVANVLGLYAEGAKPPHGFRLTQLGAAVAEESAISVITDLLHWLGACGRDPDEVLDRAQIRFEAESR